MPELENTLNNAERPTLTQKRSLGSDNFTGSIPKIGSFDKPIRLQGNASGVVRKPPIERSKPINNDEDSKSSSPRLVIWVIIVIALAVASYFALKNVLNPVEIDTDNTVEPTITVVVDPLEKFYDRFLKDDIEALDIKADSDYTTSSQKLGENTTSEFNLTNVLVTKYSSFTRIAFTTSPISGDAVIPEILAEYSLPPQSKITLTMLNTMLDENTSVLENKILAIGTESVSSLMSETSNMVGGALLITINLNQDTKYVLHLSSEDEPVIYLDIKESEAVVEPSTTPIVTSTTTVSPTVTVKPTTLIGQTETSYSTEAQELNNSLINNSASVGTFENGKTFNWVDYSDAFYFYRAINKGDGGTKYPTVKAKYEGNVLVVEVLNLQSRNVTSPTLDFPGARDVSSLDASQSGNVLRFEFNVESVKPYKLSFKTHLGSESLLIQIKH